MNFLKRIIVVCCGFFAACQPTKTVVVNNNPELLNNQWKVTTIKEKASGLSISNPSKKDIILTFKENNSIKLQLSVNSCGGNYEADSQNILIKGIYCTERCCDNDFDKKLLTIFKASNPYQLTENSLIISDETYEMKATLIED